MNEQPNNSDIRNELNKLKSQSDDHKILIKQFKKDLGSVASHNDFLTILDSIIHQGNLVHKRVLDAVKGADKKSTDIFYEEIRKDHQLAPVSALLDFNNTFHQDIAEAKERLSRQALKEQLSKHQFEAAENYIDNIKKLESLSLLLNAEIDRLKKQLSETTSMSQVDELESKITELHQSMNLVYGRLVAFPENEETAGAVINFLENNPDIFSIIKRFNVYGTLEDDILHSTARLQKELSSSRIQI